MIFEDMEAKAKGARAFVACAYFLAHLRAKFCPSDHEGEGGEAKEKFERNMGVEGPWSKNTIVASACA